ncbi:TetR/AcrR family transcriptional regulator [Rathayibacter sp. KR2-224]|uniref:TetR/AcrR family transcriptional regulator n=1 Tax=Rathayibacter sp. KR2-224 TaxID=3400913 RepID=UPI003C09C6BE
MVRWEPDAKGRLQRAALELYGERGFEATTVQDIAERSGVTERTFFRHFADKREVLFDGSNLLQNGMVGALSEAPASAGPMQLIVAMLEAAGGFFDGRHEYSKQRAAVIDVNQGLMERELLKLSTMSSAIAAELQSRGIQAEAAALAADLGVALFHGAFRRWVQGDDGIEFSQRVRETLAEFAVLAAEVAAPQAAANVRR